MKKIFIISLLMIFIISLNSCSTKKFDISDKDNLYVQIVFKNGDKINLKLNYDAAPITVTNFVELASSSFYKNTILHRVISDFMIQGGGYYLDNNDMPTLKKADTIKGEFSENGVNNNIKHELGVISMARSNDYNSASSQFFICSATCNWLNGSYAAFGKTYDEKSNEVILKISNTKTYYYSSLFTDYPVNPIIIKNIKLRNKAF